MREFSVIDSATSVEQLRLRLKEGELEQYGEAFTPDFVYEVINRLPRFSTMRVSHSNPHSRTINLTILSF
jgi:ubiquitin carboxyl-terminal hydrolase 10